MIDRPEFRLIVPGEPIAQPRHQSRIVYPSNARLQAVRSVEQLRKLLRTQQYVPAKHPVHGFRQQVAMLARRRWPGPVVPAGTPLRLDVRLVFARPQAITWKRKPMPRIWHTKTPDCDNVVKAVKDALSGVVYDDDRQIACESVAKWVAAGSEQPHTVIEIRELT